MARKVDPEAGESFLSRWTKIINAQSTREEPPMTPPTTRDAMIAAELADRLFKISVQFVGKNPFQGRVGLLFDLANDVLDNLPVVLASLRSLASAPAESVERVFSMPDEETQMRLASEQDQYPSAPQAMIVPCIWDADANQFVSSYSIRGAELCRELGVTDLPKAPASADQSDAGRDGVIEAVARAFGRNGGDAEFAMEKLSREGYAVVALASAPAETVGRGEDAKLRDFCFRIFMHAKEGRNPDDGGPVDWMSDTLPMVNEWIAATCRLPSADRDAIREALNSTILWASKRCPCNDDSPKICPLCDADIDKDRCMAVDVSFPKRIREQLTAALALIGER